MAVFVRTPGELTELAVRLMSARSVAVDTEFHGERTYVPRPMLIQLCPDDGEVALVDANVGLPLQTLGPVLSSRRLVMHGADADLEILQRCANVTPSEVFDTQVAAGFCGFGFPVRLPDLTEALLGVRLAKTETVSDWSRRPLTPEQLEYAQMDVRVLAGLEAKLRERVPEALSTACRACTAEQVARALRPADPEKLWRSIPGAGTLRPAERAVLRRLAAWRDELARARDVPRHSLLSDSHLLDLSRRRPATFEDLRKNRRLPSAFIKGWGEEALRVVAEGLREAPPEPLPSRAVSDLMSAAARTLEHQTGVAAELLMPPHVMADILARRIVVDWRENLARSPLLDFVDGRTALTFSGAWVQTDEKNAQARGGHGRPW